MKRFIIRCLVFLPFVFLIIALYIWTFSFNNLDFYYNKVTGGRKNSLVIGNSKPSQGIKPSTLDRILELEEGNQFYNFSFAANYSPYGPVYYNSIVSKLDPSTSNALFILSVDPGSISSTSKGVNDASAFEENNTFLANISSVDMRLNLDYILFRQEVFYKKLFSNTIRGKGNLHEDGWLEITVKTDSNTVAGRMKRNERFFKGDRYVYSAKRIEYLKKLICKLKKHGRVFLIRMPIHETFVEKQTKAAPGFEKVILDLSNEMDVSYKSYIKDNERYEYTDGIHLTKYSAEEFSRELANWINNIRNRL